MEKLVYSIPELASLLHMGDETLRALVRKGHIPGLLPTPFKRKLVISKVQVDAFLAGEKLEDIKKRFTIQKRRRTYAHIEESKITEAYRLYNENLSWKWKELGEAVGINPSTLRHIFKRRWGTTIRKMRESIGGKGNQKEDYSLESIADIISGLSDLAKKLRYERDTFEEQVGLLETSLKEKTLQVEGLLGKGNNLATKLIEAQNLLAQEHRRY